MDRLHPSAMRGRRLWWLLDLTWGGQVLRLSDAELDVETEDGEVLHYYGLLDGLDVAEEIDFLSDASATGASVAIDTLLPVAVARLAAQGHDLAAATAQLARWIEGTTYEERRVVLTGTVRDPEHGDDNEPVSFSLEANAWDDGILLPGSDLQVTGFNWTTDEITTLAPEELGLAYPLVFGTPGRVSARIDEDGWKSGSQGVWIEHDPVPRSSSNVSGVTVLIAGHHVTASTVIGNTDEYVGGYRFPVVNTYDRRGHPIAVIPFYSSVSGNDDDMTYEGPATYTWGDDATTVNPSALGDASLDPSFQPQSGEYKSIYIAWYDNTDADGGGMRAPDGGLLRGAGDILEYLLSFTSVPVNRGRFQAAKGLLNGYKLDFCIDAQVKAWEFIQANLLPILPVTIVSGPNGLYPIVWRYDAGPRDAICHLDLTTDPRIERVSSIQLDRSKILNRFNLKYALSIRTGEYQGSLRLDAYPDTNEDTDESYAALVSYPCFVSQNRYKLPNGDPLVSEEELESICIYDDATAVAVLAWRARAYALARRRVSYAVPEDAYGWLERGQVITISDPDLYWTDQLALVESVRTTGGSTITLGLLLIEDPHRDARLAA